MFLYINWTQSIKFIHHYVALSHFHKGFKHISKTLLALISILQAVKSVIQNTGEKPGTNTEIRTTVRIWVLRTARRPIRMQDSSKPYINL